MQILLLAAGDNDKSFQKDIGYPDYLLERDGIPLIQYLVEKCLDLNPSKIVCLMPQIDINKYHLQNMLHQISPVVSVRGVFGQTMGAACTALLSVGSINHDNELLILNSNELIDDSLINIIEGFRSDQCDAGIVIFKSLHPRYSFARLDERSYVVEMAEKNPISNNAVAGFYWFKNGRVFIDAVEDMIRKDTRINNNFYIAPSINELILKHKKIGVYRIDSRKYHPLKNSRQLDTFENLGAI